MKTAEIDKIFTYHPPTPGALPVNYSDSPETSLLEQTTRYVNIREDARKFAHLINHYCPDSREKSTAITLLQQVVMNANAAIAIHEKV